MITSEWHETDVDGSAMRLHVSTPADAGARPGILVMQHQAGVDGFIQEMTRRLADAG